MVAVTLAATAEATELITPTFSAGLLALRLGDATGGVTFTALGVELPEPNIQKHKY